jgi:glycosyltransferase involved in cell wall biosynthesis
MSLPLDIDVVIPCRNEAGFIRNCLLSVVESGYAYGRLGIYVVDGMSSDGTREIVNFLAGQYPDIRLIDNPHLFTPQALNLGIRASTASVVVILGAHSQVVKGYFELCVETFQRNPGVGCVGGRIVNIPVNSVAEAVSLAMSSVFGVGNARFRTGGAEGPTDTVAFGAYRSEVFAQAGYFDEELVRNQDDEFNYRIQKYGFGIYFNPQIVAEYYVRASFAGLFRQYFQYGYWKVYVNRKHRRITTLRQVVPLLFVLFLMSGLPAGLAGGYVLISWFAGLALYFLGSLVSAIRLVSNPGKVIRTMYAFLLMHLAYGLGYLEGIARFVLLKRGPSPRKTALTR